MIGGLKLLANVTAIGLFISSIGIYLKGITLVVHKRDVIIHHHDDKNKAPEKPRLCTHRERLEGIELACQSRHGVQWKNMSLIPFSSFPNLLVDDRHKLMYCGFAKAASTSWLTHFVKASGKWKSGRKISIRGKSIERYGLKRLNSLSEDEARDKLRTYKKMIVVRHPLDRLVSAWRDKFFMKDSPYRQSIGKRIIEKFRGGYHPGDTCTFDEFARFVALGSTDPHWGTYKSCAPCVVRYDYISRTETTKQDSGDVMTALGLGNQLPVVHAHRSTGLSDTESHLWQFENVTQHVYDKLMAVYGADMNMYGYGYRYDDRTAYCSFQKSIGEHCC